MYLADIFSMVPASPAPQAPPQSSGDSSSDFNSLLQDKANSQAPTAEPEAEGKQPSEAPLGTNPPPKQPATEGEALSMELAALFLLPPVQTQQVLPLVSDATQLAAPLVATATEAAQPPSAQTLPTATVAQNSLPAQAAPAAAVAQAAPAPAQVAPAQPPLPQATQSAAAVLQTEAAPTAEQLVAPVAENQTGDKQDFSTEIEPFAKPLFADVKNSPVKVGEAPQLDTQAPDFEQQLGKELSKAMAKGEENITLRLSPASLGNLVVAFSRTPDGQVHVLLHAATETASKLLGERAPELGALLRGNLQSPVYVEVAQNETAQQYHQPDGQSKNQQQPEQQQQQKQSEEQPQDFMQQLRLGLLDLTAVPM